MAAWSTVPSASANGHSATAPEPAVGSGSDSAGGASDAVRCSSATMTAPRSGRPARNGRIRSTRSVSTKATLEPESSSP